MLTNSILSPEELSLIVARAKDNLIDFEIATNPKYIPNWHHELIARELEHIEKYGDRDYKILLVTLPPRHGKSLQCSIDFPAWYLGKNPDKEIITASYSGELAQDFGTKAREKVASPEYQIIFPNVFLKEDEQSRAKWRTNKNGSFISVGAGGALTGRGSDILIIDDPVKNREEAESFIYRERIWNWFTSTAFTRLQPKGVCIVIATRWHVDDLIGRILLHSELSKRTKVMRFPAIADADDEYRKAEEPLWKERYGLQELEEIKSTIGVYDWHSLYMCTPVLTEDQTFKPEWIKKISVAELDKKKCRKFLTIDTATGNKSKSDYTGFCDNSVDRENYWHFRAWHSRCNSEELVDKIFSLHTQRRYEKIGIEKTAYTEGLQSYLYEEQRKRDMFLPLVELKHGGRSKDVRIREGLVARYAAGSIFHVEHECTALEEEMIQFPNGRYDDILDSCFVAGTLVLCKRGNIPIENIVVGDLVMTRKGYKKVLVATSTGRKKVINKIGLVGTPNHPIITTRGVVDLQYVTASSILYKWNEKLSCIEEKSTTEIQNQNYGNIESTFGDMVQETKFHLLSIVKSGLIILEKYLSGIISITKTAIHSIMKSQILNVFPLLNTQNITVINLNDWNNKGDLRRLGENLQKNGTTQKRVENGIGNTLLRLLMELRKKWNVLNVRKNIRQLSNDHLGIVEEDVRRDLMLENSGKQTQITTDKKMVYNLEVEDVHEYFANGILVHNCAYQLQIVKYRNFVHVNPRSFIKVANPAR